jgi:hypothetical protein
MVLLSALMGAAGTLVRFKQAGTLVSTLGGALSAGTSFSRGLAAAAAGDSELKAALAAKIPGEQVISHAAFAIACRLLAAQ